MNISKVIPLFTLLIISAVVATPSSLKAEPLLENTSEVSTRQPLDDIPQRNLMQLVKGSGPEIFLIKDGERRWITDSKTFDTYGFNYSQVKEIFDEELNNYLEGTPITRNGTLLKGSDSNVYIVINGIRRLVTPSVFNKYQFQNQDVNFVSDNHLLSIPEGSAFH